MNTRLQQFLGAENISQSQFADELGVARASVSHILAGRNKPGYEFLTSLMARYPRLNMEWLLIGKGKMYKDMQVSIEEEVKENASISEPAPASPAQPSPSLQPALAKSDYAKIDESALSDTQTDLFSQISYPQEPKNEPKPVQLSDTQRKIKKVIIFFDDGTFQEI
ncbi:MAG: helix-turn-helix transcriptional regulator [Bacteroidales bacterium]|nr:helix-turn-helix transcriptional regulator [Bacteroidales bacterium]